MNIFFFFNDTATTEIYTLSLHDALPISWGPRAFESATTILSPASAVDGDGCIGVVDRKSTRLNSSHGYISYAVFCLKKKKITSSVVSAPKSNEPSLRAVLGHAVQLWSQP